MKLAIEVSVLNNGSKTGVYHYTKRLLRAFLQLDRENQHTAVYLGAKVDLDLGDPKLVTRNLRWLPRRLYNLSLRTPFALPIDLLTGLRPDVFLFTGFVRWPLTRTKRSITIIYDTAYLDYPEAIKTNHFRHYLARAVPRSIERSTKIVTISDYTKQQLVSHYGTAADKITVIPPALDHEVFRPSSNGNIELIKKAYGITKPYILYLGTIEPRKNVVGILKAYLALPESIRVGRQLVMAGGKGWMSSDFDALAKTVPAEQLVLTGYVADDDEPALYSGADLFVYPSHYEGWGMPLLEAMACGTPTISANNSSLPQAGGDAPLYVDAADEKALTEAIERVLGDEKLAAEMIKRGQAHASDFTWDNSARLLKDLLDEL
jgi:glycosyltransferase involved in cell wall biosynthesis